MLHTRNNNIKSLKLFSSLFFALSRCIRSLIHVRSVISVIDLPADISSKNSKQIFLRNTRLCNSTNEKKTRWLSRISLLHVCRPSETWHRVKKNRKIFGVKYSHELSFYASDLLNFYSTRSLPALRGAEANSDSKFMRKHFIGFFFACEGDGPWKMCVEMCWCDKGKHFRPFCTAHAEGAKGWWSCSKQCCAPNGMKMLFFLRRYEK